MTPKRSRPQERVRAIDSSWRYRRRHRSTRHRLTPRPARDLVRHETILEHQLDPALQNRALRQRLPTHPMAGLVIDLALPAPPQNDAPRRRADLTGEIAQNESHDLCRLNTK
jgi:hypothetical protein